MNLEHAFLSAKRRYKVLLREKNSKPSGSVDPLLATELKALEEKFPDLIQLSGITTERDVLPSLLTANDKASNHRDGVTSLDSYEEGDSTVLQNSPPQISNSTDSPAPARNDEEHSPRLKEKNELKRLFLLATFVLDLYNKFHERSAFDPLSYMKVLFFSIANALFHVFVCDPCSILGVNVMPSLFCCMIHLTNLYSLCIRQKDRMLFTMLLAYICLDFVPSLVTSSVFYLLTISFLNKLIAMNLHFQCDAFSEEL
ncbi:unnamed protein product [Phytomonas sp. EM1]|nr:unnamed protein product [Phytomonas sp. EM1]|eukprot:CCW64203.1 unnamed protein product [Phytomonas sp. isolate EM1]